MDNFISIIIFTLPGLLAYLWIQLFGLTPTQKQGTTEVVAISALLWIPIVTVVLGIYQLLALLLHVQPFFKSNWMLLSGKITDITILAKNTWFLLYYVISSAFVSFYIAKFITSKGYKIILDKINKVREENEIAPLSRQSTVWNETFLNNSGQIVEFSKLDNPEEKLVGCLIKVPRAHEAERNIVLEAVDHWGNIMEYYEVQIDKAFIDTNNGIIIKIYNFNEAMQAQEYYNQRVIDGTIS